MVNIEIDPSELDNANDNLSDLVETIKTEAESLQRELASEMIDFIEASIRMNFDDVRTRDDQTSLLDAFKTFPNGESVLITTSWSDADHARPLESGVPPHPIRPNDPDGALAFQPENVGDYPKSVQVGGGYVRLGGVEWKPDKSETAAGYEYVLEAQREWEEPAKMKINDSLQDAIKDAKFNRV